MRIMQNGQAKEVSVQFVVDKENYDGYAESILYDGVCPYTKQTAAEYEKNGYTVMTEDEFGTFDKAFEDSLCGDWKEITEEQFQEALNILPPIKWERGGFYIGEPTRGSLYGFYQRIGDKYYTSLQSFYTDRQTIINSLSLWIAGYEPKEVY